MDILENDQVLSNIALDLFPDNEDQRNAFLQGVQFMQSRMSAGVQLIQQERLEQVVKHGWDIEHDSVYENGELLQAAKFCIEPLVYAWPQNWLVKFGEKIFYNSRIDQLKKAGAFIAAEIDRLLAKQEKEKQQKAQINPVTYNKAKQVSSDFSNLIKESWMGLAKEALSTENTLIERILEMMFGEDISEELAKAEARNLTKFTMQGVDDSYDLAYKNHKIGTVKREIINNSIKFTFTPVNYGKSE